VGNFLLILQIHVSIPQS